MKYLYIVLWLSATSVLFIFGSKHYLCKVRGLCNEASNVTTTKEIKPILPGRGLEILGSNRQLVYTFPQSPIISKGEVLNRTLFVFGKLSVITGH